MKCFEHAFTIFFFWRCCSAIHVPSAHWRKAQNLERSLETGSRRDFDALFSLKNLYFCCLIFFIVLASAAVSAESSSENAMDYICTYFYLGTLH